MKDKSEVLLLTNGMRKKGLLMPFPRFGNRFCFLLPAMIYCLYPRFMPFTFALLIHLIFFVLNKKVCWCCKIFRNLLADVMRHLLQRRL